MEGEAHADERHPAQVTAAGSNPASSSTGIVSRNVYLFSFLAAGKDLSRRRVNTVAMRKAATHDSRTDGPPVLVTRRKYGTAGDGTHFRQ